MEQTYSEIEEAEVRKFEKKWSGANICFGCNGGCAITTNMMNEMLNDIRLSHQVIRNATAKACELKEKTGKIKTKYDKAGEWESSNFIGFSQAKGWNAAITAQRQSYEKWVN